MIDKIILGYLKIKELTSYDIKKAMDKSVNHFYSSSLGSINPALKKLEKNGHVTCTEVVENSRVKKYYKITSQGLKVYHNWQKEPIEIGRLKDDFLVRLFFMGDNDIAHRKQLLTDYLEEINEMKTTLLQIKEQQQNNEIPDKYAEIVKYQIATLEFGIDYYTFTCKWFKNLLKKENP